MKVVKITPKKEGVVLLFDEPYSMNGALYSTEWFVCFDKLVQLLDDCAIWSAQTLIARKKLKIARS